MLALLSVRDASVLEAERAVWSFLPAAVGVWRALRFRLSVMEEGDDIWCAVVVVNEDFARVSRRAVRFI